MELLIICIQFALVLGIALTILYVCVYLYKKIFKNK